MSEQPLISIITVTYNAGKFIGKTLQSLAAQTFNDYEYVVVDGCSKDNTLEFVRSFNHNNKTIVTEPDNGLYDAMNKGLRLAKGEYVLFLNAGDSFHQTTTLGKYAEAAKKKCRYNLWRH